MNLLRLETSQILKAATPLYCHLCASKECRCPVFKYSSSLWDRLPAATRALTTIFPPLAPARIRWLHLCCDFFLPGAPPPPLVRWVFSPAENIPPTNPTKTKNIKKSSRSRSLGWWSHTFRNAIAPTNASQRHKHFKKSWGEKGVSLFRNEALNCSKGFFAVNKKHDIWAWFLCFGRAAILSIVSISWVSSGCYFGDLPTQEISLPGNWTCAELLSKEARNQEVCRAKNFVCFVPRGLQSQNICWTSPTSPHIFFSAHAILCKRASPTASQCGQCWNPIRRRFSLLFAFVSLAPWSAEKLS